MTVKERDCVTSTQVDENAAMLQLQTGLHNAHKQAKSSAERLDGSFLSKRNTDSAASAASAVIAITGYGAGQQVWFDANALLNAHRHFDLKTIADSATAAREPAIITQEIVDAGVSDARMPFPAKRVIKANVHLKVIGKAVPRIIYDHDSD